MPRASAASASSRAVSSSGGAGSVLASSASAPKARPVVRSTRSVRGSKARRSISVDAIGEADRAATRARCASRDGRPAAPAARPARPRGPACDSPRRRPPPASRRPASIPSSALPPAGEQRRRARPARAGARRDRGRRPGSPAAARCVARRVCRRPVAPRGSHRRGELAPDAADLLDRAAVQLQPAKRVGAEARRLRLAEEIDQIDDVGAAIGPRARRPPPNDARALRADVALADQRGRQRGRRRRRRAPRPRPPAARAAG